MSTRIAAAVTLLGLTAAGVAGAHTDSSKRVPSRLLVSDTEYRIQLSRGAVTRGPALIQFVNRGQDPHDLKLRRAGAPGARTVSCPELRPGGLVQVSTRLSRGHYRLWCSLPGHEQRGMWAVLSVRRGR
jgi:hypothetical protein